jgi:hypothetical protein
MVKCNLVYTAETHRLNIGDFIDYCLGNFPELTWDRGGIVYCLKSDEEKLVKEYIEWYNLKEEIWNENTL